jgi:hypothetical protein
MPIELTQWLALFFIPQQLNQVLVVSSTRIDIIITLLHYFRAIDVCSHEVSVPTDWLLSQRCHLFLLVLNYRGGKTESYGRTFQQGNFLLISPNWYNTIQNTSIMKVTIWIMALMCKVHCISFHTLQTIYFVTATSPILLIQFRNMVFFLCDKTRLS